MKKILAGIIFFLSFVSLNSSAAEYPLRAWQLGKTGEVTLTFDVDSSGIPCNISVKKSKPEGFFERAAFNAVKEMRFEKSKPESGRLITVKFEK